MNTRKQSIEVSGVSHRLSSINRVLSGLGILVVSLFLPLAIASAPDEEVQSKDFVGQESTLYLVYSNSTPGKEREYASWYKSHISDIVKLPGFIRAQRFAAETMENRTPKYRYLVLYEVRGDPSGLLAELGKAVAAGRLEAPPAELVPEIEGSFYRPILGEGVAQSGIE
jgi:hypothetical protein